MLLYLLELSYGAVSLALEALDTYLSKTSVYKAVQAAAERVPDMKRQQVFSGLRTPALGSDVTSGKVKGEWLSRTWRGQKRRRSAVNVSCLLAWCGNHLGRGSADLALLVA